VGQLMANPPNTAQIWKYPFVTYKEGVRPPPIKYLSRGKKANKIIGENM
jgi:hypothetical protein